MGNHSSPENRSHADCRVIPNDAPTAAHVAPSALARSTKRDKLRSTCAPAAAIRGRLASARSRSRSSSQDGSPGGNEGGLPCPSTALGLHVSDRAGRSRRSGARALPSMLTLGLPSVSRHIGSAGPGTLHLRVRGGSLQRPSPGVGASSGICLRCKQARRYLFRPRSVEPVCGFPANHLHRAASTTGVQLRVATAVSTIGEPLCKGRSAAVDTPAFEGGVPSAV